jgi:hypothetical protein
MAALIRTIAIAYLLFGVLTNLAGTVSVPGSVHYHGAPFEAITIDDARGVQVTSWVGLAGDIVLWSSIALLLWRLADIMESGRDTQALGKQPLFWRPNKPWKRVLRASCLGLLWLTCIWMLWFYPLARPRPMPDTGVETAKVYKMGLLHAYSRTDLYEPVRGPDGELLAAMVSHPTFARGSGFAATIGLTAVVCGVPLVLIVWAEWRLLSTIGRRR